MLSFITCPRSDARLASLRQNLDQALSAGNTPPAELVFRHHPTCLATAYNAAIDQANGDLLVFLHDDLALLTTDAIANLVRHLQRCDVVGIAGSTRAVGGDWTDAGPPYLYGQFLHPLPPDHADRQAVCVHSAPRPLVEHMQILDGCLIAFRRPVIEKLRFDGQRFSDFDLCATDAAYRAHLAGHTLGVACDVPLWHEGGGRAPQHRRAQWHAAVAAFNQKHGLTPSRPQFVSALVPAHNIDTAVAIMRPPYWSPAPAPPVPPAA
jgi:hypothetical protein